MYDPFKYPCNNDLKMRSQRFTRAKVTTFRIGTYCLNEYTIDSPLGILKEISEKSAISSTTEKVR